MTFLKLALGLGLIWFIFAFLLVIHEYGHAWAMRRLGMRVDRIVIGTGPVLFRTGEDEFRLLPLIGMAISKDYAKASLEARAVAAAAGPAASLLLGLFLLLAYWLMPAWATLIAAKASLLLAAINLIPLPPFDGFTIVEASLARRGLRIDEGQRRQLFAIGIGTMVLLTLVL
ncbi:M50 family metallopeptidase [Noviherbaspirillum pedocola]|uniref:M50 family metallopeptidase n=1 Tax=Noviherbaspirillum pedocola TaxID=2801341 RepID=A0A934T3K8_9BURK|nr:site-2 protease family protein [Noviherbaspirillum pedocola]MBK4737888.1 M50 family metallopeptidase [Noviherbaspirillum pedocola]